METTSVPPAGKGGLWMSVLPPRPGVLSCKLVVPGGDSDVHYWKEAQASLYFKLELQGHSEWECGMLTAQLPSQHPASQEKARASHAHEPLPAQSRTPAPCPEHAGRGPAFRSTPEVLALRTLCQKGPGLGSFSQG